MLLELSYPFGPEEPKWPTNPNDSVVLDLSTTRGDICNTSTICHHMHNGTHVDAPRHFDPNGRTIDQIPAEDFLYEHPLLLYIPKGKSGRVLVEDLKPYEAQLREADILLIYSGYADLRATEPKRFIDDFPCFSKAAAVYLREAFPKLKAIAMDFLSVDSCVTAVEEGHPSHHALLDQNEAHPQRTLLLFEDVNTKKLFEYGQTPRRIYAFPIRYRGLEAAPISMVAEF